MSHPLHPPLAELAPDTDSPPADVSVSSALTDPVEGPMPPEPFEAAHRELVEEPALSLPKGRVPASPRKQAANRANAQKSTGPRTREGKERSSQNAVKHGLVVDSVERLIAAAMPEERQSYFQVIKQLFQDLLPVGAREHLLVERLAMLSLRLLRVHRVEAAAMAEEFQSATKRGHPLLFVPGQLDRVLRYDTQAERSFQRTLRELRRLQSDRQRRNAALDRQLSQLVTDR